jgi:hypothetical protein
MRNDSYDADLVRRVRARGSVVTLAVDMASEKLYGSTPGSPPTAGSSNSSPAMLSRRQRRDVGRCAGAGWWWRRLGPNLFQHRSAVVRVGVGRRIRVLDYVDRGRDRIAALTTQILSSRLAEGFGREALVLAEALMVHGYDIVVTVASVTPTADRIRTTGVAGGEPVTITAPEQRTYSLVFRYANGTGRLYHHRRL